jgi:hypothetical protein
VFDPKNLKEAELQARWKACGIFALPHEQQPWRLALLQAFEEAIKVDDVYCEISSGKRGGPMVGSE